MLEQSRLMGFIPTRDAERAVRFYVDVLGLTFVADDGFAIAVESNGNPIRIVRMPSHTPLPYTILGWQVQDLARSAEQMIAAGVIPLDVPHFDQDALGIWTSPSGSRIFWFHDPDGNVLSLSQP